MSLNPLPLWHTALLLAPALLWGVAAASIRNTTHSAAPAWRLAHGASLAALAAAALSLLAVLMGSSGSWWGWRVDLLGGLVMLCVSFIAWVIVRYSQPYLNAEPRERHYLRWLMATLCAVAVVLASNHLLVLAAAWTASSLALHRLLTFFGDRPAAVVAAHKKFIVARLADLCMFVAVVLLARAFGSWQIDDIVDSVAAVSSASSARAMPDGASIAIFLVAIAALLKCAQLPFHGWLIQVMEAPTPVSALLHAGVVNLGGFVLMRLAPLVAEVPLAQVLLVVFGTLTAVLAALVMCTRISVKVMLAWSTCAQMGFMLLQCGLGLWGTALLHLLAHSLYKAHAFLAAAGAVRRSQEMQLSGAGVAPRMWPLLGAGVLALLATLLAAALWRGLVLPLLPMPAAANSPALMVMTGIVAMALVPLLWRSGPARSMALWLRLLGGSVAVALLYFGAQALFNHAVVPAPAVAPWWLCAAVALVFVALFLMQSLLVCRPQGVIAQRLYPWFYGGLFLDEKFNRWAFAVLPPPAPKQQPATLWPHASSSTGSVP
jgi:NAD(P)H-quinone oxidoreductase subunit 5